jgi:hypothetical protein
MHAAKKDDLPPPQPKAERGVRSDVKKPLEQVQLTTFVHVLICALLVCLAWYAYRTTIVAVEAYRSTGSSPASSSTFLSLRTHPIWQFVSRKLGWGEGGYEPYSGGPHLDVEQRIEELADALGVHPLDFAVAIADAVRQFVPSSSLTSLASEAKKSGGGRIMDALLGEHIADAVAGRG